MTGDRSGVLVGAERLRAYSRLQGLWDEASVSGPCRLVVVRGASGSGRTMMLAGLYRHCAMMQALPRYWPDDLAPGVGGLDHRLVRDVLFPDPVVPEHGSRLGLFWWALRARAGGCAAQDGQGQLRKHLAGLADAVSEADQLTRTRLRAAADAACLFATILPVAPGLKSVLDVVGAMKDASSVDSVLARASRTRQGLIDQALGAAGGRELAMGTRRASAEAAENNARSWHWWPGSCRLR